MDSLESFPLRCYVDHGVIHFEIGQDILAFAAKNHPDFWEEDVQIIDSQILALDVLREINEEAGDGSTRLTRMLDEAIRQAIGNGTEGVVINEREES